MKVTLPIILSLLSLFCSQKAIAQSVPLLENDSLLKAYLNQSRFDIDSGANAVVLYEKGVADFKDYNYEMHHIVDYTIVYKVEKIIKVLKNGSLQEGDINLPYSENAKVKDVIGTTINLENGKIVRTPLGRKEILKENLAEGYNQYKFSLRGVKPGSIVHYTFTYTFDLSGYRLANRYFNLEWLFQNEFPTLLSEFELIISSVTFKDIILTPKNLSFTNRSTEKEYKESDEGHYGTIYPLTRFNETQSYIRKFWKKSNLPPFKKEPKITNSNNWKPRLRLVLSNLSSHYTRSTLQNWDSANHEFYYDNIGFGKLVFITPSSEKDTALDKLTKASGNQYELAQSIYKCFRDSVTSTDFAATLSDYLKLSKKAKKSYSSNVNLRLTQILRKAGLKAFPIVQSTTNNGRISYDYFEPDAINYILSLVLIDNRYYLLDATTRHQPFGVLRPRSYNGFAWLITEKGVPIDISPDSLSDKVVYTATAKPAAQPGLYSFKLEQKLGNVGGPAMRAMWKEDSVAVKKELEEAIHKLECKMSLKQLKLHNLDNPDTALVVTYDMELQLDADNDITYLNPFFHKFYDTNPFIETKRIHPVEFGHTFNYTFLLKFQLPDGYQMEEYSNPASISLNKGDMQYRNNMQYDTEKKLFTLSSTLNSKTATVAAEDYDALRSFYDRVITEQNKKIVIRKTK